MITKNMSPEEVANYVEEFVKRHISFDKRKTERYEIIKIIPFISNTKITLTLQNEIHAINNEENSLDKEHQEIIQKFLEYIFQNKENKKLLDIKTSFVNEEIFEFEFTGILGKPLYSVMTLNSYFELSGTSTKDRKVPREANLTNSISYKKFISVLNENYIILAEKLI